jgi:hypothetical protein
MRAIAAQERTFDLVVTEREDLADHRDDSSHECSGRHLTLSRGLNQEPS